jgi:hypothetical protein
VNVKRLLTGPAWLLVLAGALLACFTWGGWLNQPVMWTYVWHDTDLARLSLRLGFVPDGNTVLPLVGVGLMLTVAVLLVAVALWNLRPGPPPTGGAVR